MDELQNTQFEGNAYFVTLTVCSVALILMRGNVVPDVCGNLNIDGGYVDTLYCN